jgi:CDP-diacylglycerol--glycerol-3-phosphate 3-phosphatidyltransferase
MKLTIPNQLTILRIILTPFFVYFYLGNSLQDKIIGTIIFVLASATDWYDGYIARKLNQITRWGQFMDPLADKILTASALCVFAYMHYLHWWMVWIMIARDFVMTVLRIFALLMGKAIVTSYLAKVKTTVEMIAIFILLLYLNIPGTEIKDLSVYPPPYTHWTSLLFGGVTVLTVFTAVQYFIENRSHLMEMYNRTVKLFGR